MKDCVNALVIGGAVFAVALGLLFYDRSLSNGSPVVKPVEKKPAKVRTC